MKKLLLIFFLNLLLCEAYTQTILCDNSRIEDAYNLAINTIKINVRHGILAAGGDYGGEWTRDIAINSWNCVSVIMPEVAEKSLWSVTINKDTIGHQYWDKIIWTIAALNHYYVTRNVEFLKQSYECADNTIRQLESLAYDKEYGLFTGPSVFNDGIAGYPEPVFDRNNFSSYVLDHKNASAIKCLSTNCVYYGAYLALAEMATILQKDDGLINDYKEKSEKLKSAVLKYFYNETEHKLYYLIDHRGVVHEYQEALGYSFAVIFGILNTRQAFGLINKAETTQFGIASLSPDFTRYSSARPGRHNNILWPMTNGFFAKACIIAGNYPSFNKELKGLTSLALDADKGNNGFWEIYNPYSGKPDGGYQAAGAGNPDYHWNSCRLQTWSATAYVNMVHSGLLGMSFNETGLKLSPYLPGDIHYLKVTGLKYNRSELSIELIGSGRKIKSFYLNGIKQDRDTVPSSLTGSNEVVILLE